MASLVLSDAKTTNEPSHQNKESVKKTKQRKKKKPRKYNKVKTENTSYLSGWKDGPPKNSQNPLIVLCQDIKDETVLKGVKKNVKSSNTLIWSGTLWDISQMFYEWSEEKLVDTLEKRILPQWKMNNYKMTPSEISSGNAQMFQGVYVGYVARILHARISRTNSKESLRTKTDKKKPNEKVGFLAGNLRTRFLEKQKIIENAGYPFKRGVVEQKNNSEIVVQKKHLAKQRGENEVANFFSIMKKIEDGKFNENQLQAIQSLIDVRQQVNITQKSKAIKSSIFPVFETIEKKKNSDEGIFEELAENESEMKQAKEKSYSPRMIKLLQRENEELRKTLLKKMTEKEIEEKLNATMRRLTFTDEKVEADDKKGQEVPLYEKLGIKL